MTNQIEEYVNPSPKHQTRYIQYGSEYWKSFRVPGETLVGFDVDVYREQSHPGQVHPPRMMFGWIANASIGYRTFTSQHDHDPESQVREELKWLFNLKPAYYVTMKAEPYQTMVALDFKFKVLNALIPNDNMSRCLIEGEKLSMQTKEEFGLFLPYNDQNTSKLSRFRTVFCHMANENPAELIEMFGWL
jgi:hypothetical protein